MCFYVFSYFSIKIFLLYYYISNLLYISLSHFRPLGVSALIHCRNNVSLVPILRK
nr:MAG TPA: hypothetical protein [Microviridae sp.]